MIACGQGVEYWIAPNRSAIILNVATILLVRTSLFALRSIPMRSVLTPGSTGIIGTYEEMTLCQDDDMTLRVVSIPRLRITNLEIRDGTLAWPYELCQVFRHPRGQTFVPSFQWSSLFVEDAHARHRRRAVPQTNRKITKLGNMCPPWCELQAFKLSPKCVCVTYSYPFFWFYQEMSTWPPLTTLFNYGSHSEMRQDRRPKLHHNPTSYVKSLDTIDE